jgi:HPt (histidine-containing phosphotransfer) domain-containing protein
MSAQVITLDGRHGGTVFERAFEASLGREAALGFVTLFQAQLAERFQTAEPEFLQADAHKVSGAAGLLGLDALGEAARVLEETCDSGSDFAPAFAALRVEVERAQARLAAWTTRLCAAA